jgi:dienelactone hydrolase
MTRASLALAALIAFTSAARAEDPSADGPYAVRKVKVDVTVNGKKTYCDVRLPKDATAPFPTVLICHGMAASTDNYEKIADHLASRGFAAVLFQQPDRWSNDTPEWAKQIHEALDALEKDTNDASNPLGGQLDFTKLGLMGHSFGGAAVIMEAASDPRVKSVVGLAPVNQANRDKVIQAAGQLTAKLLIVAGDFDWLATNKTYTRAFYNAATNAPEREYVQVSWGDHNFYTGTGGNSKLASDFYTAWLEKSLEGKVDADGWSDGTKAAEEKAKKKLSAEAFDHVTPTKGLIGALGDGR